MIYDIEAAALREFYQRFKAGDFPYLRLGQAFFNHFSLHKMKQAPDLDRLYQLDGERAESLIKRLFQPSER